MGESRVSLFVDQGCCDGQAIGWVLALRDRSVKEFVRLLRGLLSRGGWQLLNCRQNFFDGRITARRVRFGRSVDDVK